LSKNYDTKTLTWLCQQSCENMVWFFARELKAIRGGRMPEMSKYSYRSLVRYGLITRHKDRRVGGYMLTPLGEKLLREMDKNGN